MANKAIQKLSCLVDNFKRTLKDIVPFLPNLEGRCCKPTPLAWNSRANNWFVELGQLLDTNRSTW